MDYKLTDFLPTTKKECELRGWDELDVILFSGDAYVDHPSFGPAILGRMLEANGYRVAIVPQPDWHGDFRDFKKLGRPRLFFGVSPGAMDSMVNRYTANRRMRSEDAFSPDSRHDMRPDYPSIVYTQILKKLFPDVPVALGGIEASLRRISHYDYWKDELRKCILCDSGADLILYGMGERSIVELANAFADGKTLNEIHEMPQVAFYCKENEIPGGFKDDDIILHSHEECLHNKKGQAENVRHLEEEANKMHAQRMIQEVDGKYVVVNPPFPLMTTEELDAAFDLPYTRLPHPKYKGKTIPAYEMIKFSVNLHRGCFGGCSFCTISAHQGKFVVCRSKESILKEVKKIIQMPDFKGYLSDLGGPSANMYGMHGKNQKACEVCKRPSCVNPQICPNLNTDHSKLLEIYHAVDALPGIKKSFIGSGVRYDLLLHKSKDEKVNQAAREYTRELITKHVSGRLKVAPEHTSPEVLKFMRKPSFDLFYEFKRIFDKINKEEGLNQQIIPYFISSHPGCHEDTLPIAVGALTMGPAAGAILGGVFGAVSFYDAVTGASAMTGALFQVSPVNTFILCVGMRVLMGLCVGLIFNGIKHFDKPGTWSYIVSAMCAPALNTLFFMGYIVLAFYNCDYVQNLVSVKGAANPFMFVVLLVGVQGVAEFLVSGILGGIVARAVHKFLK